jgi:hypothetical protein
MTTTLINSYSTVGEYGAWLKTFSWDLFVTLTFDRRRGHDSAAGREQKLKEYLRTLEHQSRARVRCFWSEEKRNSRWSGCGQGAIAPHFHMLLACDRNPLPPLHAQLIWEGIAGKADVRVYDQSQNAAEYCAKLIGLPDANYGFHGFPRAAAA